MIRAIARQAEAERERRAKVIHAEGELQASEKLLQATIVVPLPIDVLAPFLPRGEARSG
jgi:regulator of protease activity HflC (stomatin/prohibitin superfamily)